MCLIFLNIGTYVNKIMIAGQYEVNKLCSPSDAGVSKQSLATLRKVILIYIVH